MRPNGPNLLGPTEPGAADRCSTCGHCRWRHHHGTCTEFVNCACAGRFDESGYLLSLAELPPTRPPG